ncbi:lysophospholipid acyltransferase family protein [Natronoglycomyces albus]|uniref:1-acyl-sn-glycerol-3-phosphate acyltransferase n=1 Tax=Natronoglycomyces albus TaxID=2811108 RepID=A0A895XV54_9ACTN|nr:lysophospholipid acyltransferase family protein [Natronoglycomyces albus]QSB06110.1 1-acyl-sn-glycerol-3-phosphate acyltransferase [Natronoglycomyces albus]
MPDTPTAPGNDAKKWRRPRGSERRSFWLCFAAAIVLPSMNILTRRQWRGMENIPLQGPLIYVVNHYSHFDPMVIAHFVYKSGRSPRFLLKESLTRVPVLGKIIRNTGQIPVHRGTVDATKALQAAIDQLRDGKAIIIYPEGTTSKEPNHWPMRGKTGLARLVAETGATVVPVAQWGSLAFINPLAKKRRFKFGLRRPVTVVAGEPLDLSPWKGKERTSLTEITDFAMEAVRDQLAQIRGEEAPALYEYHRKRSAAGSGESSAPASPQTVESAAEDGERANNEGNDSGSEGKSAE